MQALCGSMQALPLQSRCPLTSCSAPAYISTSRMGVVPAARCTAAPAWPQSAAVCRHRHICAAFTAQGAGTPEDPDRIPDAALASESQTAPGHCAVTFVGNVMSTPS
jgi:hypothetical protein